MNRISNSIKLEVTISTHNIFAFRRRNYFNNKKSSLPVGVGVLVALDFYSYWLDIHIHIDWLLSGEMHANILAFSQLGT